MDLGYGQALAIALELVHEPFDAPDALGVNASVGQDRDLGERTPVVKNGQVDGHEGHIGAATYSQRRPHAVDYPTHTIAAGPARQGEPAGAQHNG